MFIAHKVIENCIKGFHAPTSRYDFAWKTVNETFLHYSHHNHDCNIFNPVEELPLASVGTCSSFFRVFGAWIMLHNKWRCFLRRMLQQQEEKYWKKFPDNSASWKVGNNNQSWAPRLTDMNESSFVADKCRYTLIPCRTQSMAFASNCATRRILLCVVLLSQKP